MLRSVFAVVTGLLIVSSSIESGRAAETNVLTYHNDSYRTGWNRHETVLTTANVVPSTFGLLATVPLDEQVDAQPLVLAQQDFTATTAPGRYDVAYVATENDSVYAIDTATGAILASRNLGKPVASHCENNGPVVGITSTPVIDRAAQTMYLITYTVENGSDVYRLHAIDVRSLADVTAPIVVSASHTLSNGTVVGLSPATNRQRAALLEADGTIYAAFSSFCDQAASTTRGWVLGWNAKTLAPLASNEVTDTLATSQRSYFLNAVWMSGAGLAADEGSLFYVTSNSDPTSYDGVHDIQESFVRETPNLTRIQGLFTPSNQSSLDAGDSDFGAGGVLLIPYQKSSVVRHIAMAAGKDGNLYVVDTDALGGFSSTGNDVLGTYGIGGCWCAPSFFVGSDSIPRVVTSGGSRLAVWRLETTPSVALAQESASASLATGQDPGFFTAVSSNETTAGTAVAWAVGRPTNDNPANVTLYAFDASNAAKTLYSAVAGTWPNTGANADLVPVVANGRVLVATNKQLAIFGLLNGSAARIAVRIPAAFRAPLPRNAHEFYGRIESLRGSRVTLRLRDGHIALVDVADAQRAYRTTTLYPGEFVFVRSSALSSSGFVATAVERAKSSPALWKPDR